jgi:2OG-Fe(II) oxygenase superfamily
MASASVIVEDQKLFPYSHWRAQLPSLALQFRRGEPFPHIHLQDFLQADLARELSDEFPVPNSSAWIQYKHYNEDKTGLTKRELFPPLLAKVTDELNSLEFVAWISELTGIPGLIADPDLEGGGLHQSTRGGFLNVHTDFNMHHYHKNWRRRINLILYLNPDWRPEWGGALELWDRNMHQCVTKISPLLNHAVIFNSNEISYHGFPGRLTCPENVSRKSLAFYYYTVERDGIHDTHSTNYMPRPEDGRAKAMLIWLDKKAVHVYSKAKEKFGIGDGFASKVLGLLSRKQQPARIEPIVTNPDAHPVAPLRAAQDSKL